METGDVLAYLRKRLRGRGGEAVIMQERTVSADHEGVSGPVLSVSIASRVRSVKIAAR
jgi:hypothetical protein